VKSDPSAAIATGAQSPGAVGTVDSSESALLGAVLARAFRDNPLNRAVIRGSADRRLRSNLHGMNTMLASAFGRAMILGARATDGGAGGAWAGGLVALPPFGYPLPSPVFWAQLLSVFTQGFGVVQRWGQVFAELEHVHPLEPHWYLSVLGVDPACQGQGHGSRLIGQWLEQVDRDESAAFLETDRQENISFYSSAGFRVLDERRVLGVAAWRMWRVHRVDGIETGQMPEIEPRGPRARVVGQPSPAQQADVTRVAGPGGAGNSKVDEDVW
jgi:ribosomal protein S18 acetylase RimI-like enzyme